MYELSGMNSYAIHSSTVMTPIISVSINTTDASLP